MNPVFIPIGGGSGSGKSVLATNIDGCLLDHTTLILMVDYYKGQGAVPKAERELNVFDSLGVVDVELLSNSITRLRNFDAIEEQPIYGFATYASKAETTHIESSPVIVARASWRCVLEA